MDGIGFGEIVEILGAATEVLLWIGGVAKGEAPSFVDADGFTQRGCLGLCVDAQCGCDEHREAKC